MGYTEKVVVIGAGISGLACAHRLKQLGLRPRVLEATERPGGLINSVRRDGFLFETGPQFPRFPLSVWQLVHDLNLESEFVAGDSRAKRYIFRRGRLHLAPFSPGGLIKTQLVGLKSKLRILAEPFGYSRPPAGEESLAEFVQRKFGAEVLDNLVDPIVSTVFLGDARKMGMESAFPALVEWERNRGSLVRGALYARRSKREAPKSDAASRPSMLTPHSNGNHNSLRVTDALPTLGSFRSGMATLPERLAEELNGEITYKAAVESVAHSWVYAGTPKQEWLICLSSGEQIAAEYLVLAVPAHVAAKLLETSIPQLASHLKAIEYAPISVVASAYERSKVANRLEGFGFMVPRRKGLNTICTFWNSSLFEGRSPEGTVLITSFAGSGENDGAASEEEIAQAVEAENAHILGIWGEPLARLAWRDSHALPQYNIGHAHRVEEIYGILPTLPNLYLAGNFLKGRSIGDCVDVAYRVAENLHSQLHRQDIQLVSLFPGDKTCFSS